MTKNYLTNQRFTEFDLSEPLTRGLAEAGFEFCTPIQAESLPVALRGTDVAGQAQTGTGKTIAFLLACCQHLLTHEAPETRTKHQVRALILSPTRELAIQIHKDAEVLAKHTGLNLTLIYGGTDYEGQKKQLEEGTDVLIGTPGRLIDFYKQRCFDLSATQVVVLDEADRMFDLGFIKDIRYLLRKMPDPEKRLNLLFSATLSYRVMELAYEHMNDPSEIKIETENVVADKVKQSSFYPADTEKLPLLVNLIKQEKPEKIVIFVNTRHGVEMVSDTLTANGIENAALSGDVPQKKREKLLEGFKNEQYMALIATDVAARGLHIPAVSHVFNFDLPNDPDDYIHRIGRTARAGASGEAISFVCERYAYSIMDIEAHIGHAIAKRDLTDNLLVDIKRAKPSRKPHSKSGATQGNRTQERTNKHASRSNHPEAKSNQEKSQNTQQSSQPEHQRTTPQKPPRLTQTVSTEALIKTLKDHKRFSRRFGETPAIG